MPTILERFHELEAKQPTNDDIVDFIGVENAKAIETIGTGNKELNNQLIKDCIEIYMYFGEHYSDDDELMGDIMTMWPDAPKIFRVAMKYFEARTSEEHPFPYNKTFKTPPEMQLKINQILAWARNQTECTKITVRCEHADEFGIQDVCVLVLNDPEITDKDVTEALETGYLEPGQNFNDLMVKDLEQWSKACAAFDGSIIIRQSHENAKDTLMALAFAEGNLMAVTPEGLEKAMTQNVSPEDIASEPKSFDVEYKLFELN